MSSFEEDELGRTATAPGSRSATAPLGEPLPLAATLGRYRLERELGAGGMGVVHAAFDPDLERRVALKVLRSASGDEAQKRLLREARAMARLAHRNVVTVHEVGSAGGRDYVAMELIEGETLADWLRAKPRGERAIVDAFLSAGHGLAAAHAAGIVHRDFKPHNVLRSRDGRIVVTDFGLARDAQLATATSPTPALDPLGATMELPATAVTVGAAGASQTTPSSPSALAGLTVTGSVLGTPAYMAPEQWTGRAVTPATDQFAYCVALWEALAGERPFRGLSLDELRAAVAAGPEALDASRIPRRLRAILRRGLCPDPARRWPDMDTLLARLERAERRSMKLALVLAGAAIASLIVALVIFRAGGRAVANACPPPVADPTNVWSPALSDQLRARSPDAVRLFDADMSAWRSQRARACTEAPALRTVQLACLDGVLARMDAVRRAAMLPPEPVIADIVAAELVQPGVCNKADPPRLVSHYSDASVQGLALQRIPSTAAAYDDATAAKALAGTVGDECAHAQVELARVQYGKTGLARQALDTVQAASEQCGDERLRVEVMIWAMWYRMNEFLDPKLPKLVANLDHAVERVEQPDLRASVDSLKGQIARTTGETDKALGYFAKAIDGYGTRRPRGQLLAVRRQIEILLTRSGPGDRAQASERVAKWLPAARAEGDAASVDELSRDEAVIQWLGGDTAGADAKLAALPPAPDLDRPRSIGKPLHGTVVDAQGAPVAGAEVVAGDVVTADSSALGLGFGPGADAIHVTTDAKGAFRFDSVPEAGGVAAQHGALRSLGAAPKDGMRLVLAPTGSVSGKVLLGTAPPSNLAVILYSAAPGASPMLQFVAPLAADGSFSLAGVPRGPVKIGVAFHGGSGQTFRAQDLYVGAKPVTGVTLPIAGGRALRVLARSATSTPLTGAIVIVAPGKLDISTTRDLPTRILSTGGLASETARAVIGEPPAEVAHDIRDGDVLATFASAPAEGTVCAFGIQGDLSDPAFVEKLRHHLSDLKVSCVPLGAATTVVTIEVPPMKRLD